MTHDRWLVTDSKGGVLGSFKEGLVQLPTAISARLGERVKLEWKVCVCVCVCVC